MVISFDIDDTLISHSSEFEVEKKGFISKAVRAESIRRGTIELVKELLSRNHTFWIYTTSFRNRFALWRTFWSYGIPPSRVINERINRKVMKLKHCTASKNPNLFGIDVHVDDSVGVMLEGERLGFVVVHVEVADVDWVTSTLQAIEQYED